MANDLRFSIRHESAQFNVATFSCRSHNSNEMQVSSKEPSEMCMKNDKITFDEKSHLMKMGKQHACFIFSTI